MSLAEKNPGELARELRERQGPGQRSRAAC